MGLAFVVNVREGQHDCYTYYAEPPSQHTAPGEDSGATSWVPARFPSTLSMIEIGGLCLARATSTMTHEALCLILHLSLIHI